MPLQAKRSGLVALASNHSGVTVVVPIMVIGCFKRHSLGEQPELTQGVRSNGCLRERDEQAA